MGIYSLGINFGVMFGFVQSSYYVQAPIRPVAVGGPALSAFVMFVEVVGRTVAPSRGPQ